MGTRKSRLNETVPLGTHTTSSNRWIGGVLLLYQTYIVGTLLVWQYLGKFQEDLELDFKVFFFVDSGSAYIVLEKSE